MVFFYHYLLLICWHPCVLADMDLEVFIQYLEAKALHIFSSKVYHSLSLLIPMYSSLMCTENISPKAGK